MDNEEATRILDGAERELRAEPYEALVARYVGESDTRTVVAESGVQYQLEVQGFWDNLKPGNLRVIIAVDDGGWRTWTKPLSTDFIMAPDGSFVGE